MTEKDLDTLCAHIAQLPMEELTALESSGLLPPLQPANPGNHQETVAEIRRTLECIPSKEARIHLIASIYCWLITHNRLSSWFLYRLDDTTVDITGCNLLKRVGALITPRCSDTNLVCIGNASGCVGTVMAIDPASRRDDQHTVLGMYVWNYIPYMAVCISCLLSVEGYGDLFTLVFDRGHSDCLVGYYPDFDGAFAAACRHLLRAHDPDRLLDK
ncbi:hypothetical protein HPB50_005954 [Hyalomma asiaticum]|uniref:Uncharacterized protein n=1 Tax=Hyalomma asiaticum TaxID=266040 RepID=A0ACB7RMX9_HYAAI|nr:hypothetical protein HPB50_005954 [Hyalomma asiaticum]